MTAMSSAARRMDSAPEPDEDWFGEGSSFDTGEELASALFALAGTVDPMLGAPPPVLEPVASAAGVIDEIFDWVEPGGAPSGAAIRMVPVVAEPRPAPLTWGVRTSATEGPPPRPGEAGWSIRNSVQVLHSADDVLRRLREEAVLAAFSSAASVFQLALEPSRRSRHPRCAA
jgi:hypothetical protein